MAITHIMHFTDNEEMSRAMYELDIYITPLSQEENEFDGDAPNEVVFTTSKPLPKNKIVLLLKRLDPLDHLFNEQE